MFVCECEAEFVLFYVIVFSFYVGIYLYVCMHKPVCLCSNYVYKDLN